MVGVVFRNQFYTVLKAAVCSQITVIPICVHLRLFLEITKAGGGGGGGCFLARAIRLTVRTLEPLHLDFSLKPFGHIVTKFQVN